MLPSARVKQIATIPSSSTSRSPPCEEPPGSFYRHLLKRPEAGPRKRNSVRQRVTCCSMLALLRNTQDSKSKELLKSQLALAHRRSWTCLMLGFVLGLLTRFPPYATEVSGNGYPRVDYHFLLQPPPALI